MVDIKTPDFDRIDDLIILTFKALATVEVPGTMVQAMDGVIANSAGLEQALRTLY